MIKIILLFCCFATSGAFIQMIPRGIRGDAKAWAHDQPPEHTLTKQRELVSSLESARSKILQVKEKTPGQWDGVKRSLVCSGKRQTLLVFSPIDKAIFNYTCQKSQFLTDNCGKCIEGKSGPSSHEVFSYDDFICQAEYSEWDPKIKQPHTSICAVGPLQFRDCHHVKTSVEFVTWAMIDNHLIILEKYNLGWIEGPFFSLFSCTNKSEECEIEACKSGMCDGDANFCANFVCTKEEPVCYCSRNKQMGVLQLSFNSMDVIPKCFGRSLWGVKRPTRAKRDIENIPCSDCSSDCLPEGIKIIVRHFDPGHYRLCVGPHCFVGNADAKEFTIPVNPSSRITSEEFFLSVWSKDKGTHYTYEGRCPEISACQAVDCTLCLANWVNINCFSREKWVVVALALCLALIIVAAAIKAIKFILTTVKWIMWPFYVCLKFCFKHSRLACERKAGSVHAAYRRMESDTLEDDSSVTLLSSPVYRPTTEPVPPRHLAQKMKKIIFGATILLMVQPGLSCSESVVLTASGESCVDFGNGTWSCEFSSSALVAASPLNQETCLILQSPAGKVSGVLKLKTKSLKLVCDKSDLYWVPRVTHRCIGVRRCHLMGDCKGDSCSQVKENFYSVEWGVPMDIMKQLGWSYCIEQCGGALCKCFNMNPSCFYLRKTFSAIDDSVYSVYECPSWKYKLEVESTLRDVTEREHVLPGIISHFGWGSIQLDALTAPPSTALNRCFVQSGQGQVFHTHCNRRGEFILGRLGEIQCPTKSDAQRISSNCISTSSIISHKIHMDDMTCKSAIVDPEVDKQKNMLPSTVGDTKLFPTEAGVEAIVPSTSLIMMSVQVIKLKLASLSDKNKCSSRFVNLTGCYNCESGANLRFEVITDFGTAQAIIKCPELGVITWVMASTTVQVQRKVIHLNSSHVDTTCEVVCPGSSEKVSVKGDLIYIATYDSRHYNDTRTPSLEPRTGWGIDWWSWLRFSWFRWVWIVLICLVGGIILLAVLVNLPSFLTKRKRG
uniref:Envelopment polyprotein n=1 Tax=Kabuto mountain virus TaxID=1851087 RepID=A0A679C9D3_9VIRU|nr:envelope glycoprotein [Kabuto mountain virus]